MAAQHANRLFILQQIFDELQMVTQHVTDEELGATRYLSKAAALVELLEVSDCGSVGGFDRTNPHQHVTGCEVFDRFLTLLRKRKGDEKRIKPVCNANVATLTQFFTELAELREKVYDTHGVR